jgi:hypothetical protein
VKYVEYRADWLDEPAEKQMDYARHLLSPFHVSDELMERFVHDAREHRQRLPPRRMDDEVDE